MIVLQTLAALAASPLFWVPLVAMSLLFLITHALYFVSGYRIYRKIGFSRRRAAWVSFLDLPIVKLTE